PVPGVLHDATAVRCDCRVDSVRQERRQPGMGALFVIVHEPRVASHVGGQYRRQLALDPDWPLLHHGPQTHLPHILYDGSHDTANWFWRDAHPNVGWSQRPPGLTPKGEIA